MKIPNAAALAKIFEHYIKDKKVLIADSSATARAAMARVLNEMGVKSTQILLASDFASADQAIETAKPAFIITDYDFGKRCGLELLQRQRTAKPFLKESIFVLVTGNSSQSAVARAAEEDVDTFILKPFTGEVFKASILKAVMLKIDPPEYLKVIERGKSELGAGKLDEALKTFEYSKSLDAAPALSCYYVGQTNEVKSAPDPARGSFEKGLSYNKIHYKCLVGLFENHMSKKLHTEAYEVIKRISQYFPANPQRMTTVLRLAIMTKSYEDVERYYRIFSNIDERNEEMIRYVCAALVVCGKYYLHQNFNSRALELFQKAAITASGRTKILREIISALLEFNLTTQAEEYLKRFPPDSQSQVDYLSMQYLVADRTNPRSIVIDKGRELIGKNMHDPAIYKVLIRRSAEAGLEHAVGDLVQAAAQKFPDQKEAFESLAKAKKQ